MKYLALSVIAAVILSSCNNVSNNKNKNDNSTFDSITIDSVVVDTVVYLVSQSTTPSYKASLRYQYIKDKKFAFLNDSILKSEIIMPNYEFLGNADAGIKERVDSFIAYNISDYKRDYRPLFEDDRENAEFYCIDHKVRTNIQKGKGNYFTYIAENYYYGGGAHPLNATIARNFNINTGHVLTLKDILVPNSEKFVQELIVKKLQKKFKVGSAKELEDNGIIEASTIPVTNNFILAPNKITFIYTIYEIGPYSLGEIHVDFTYKELEKYLKVL